MSSFQQDADGGWKRSKGLSAERGASAPALLSALADPARLELFCRLASSASAATEGAYQSGSARKYAKNIQRLVSVGVVKKNGDHYDADATVFAAALDEVRAMRTVGQAPDGIQSLNLSAFFADGRLREVPQNAQQRSSLLTWLASKKFSSGVWYTEAQVNAAIELVYDDFATIRRYLVDEGHLERTRDSSKYRRVVNPTS